MSASTAYLVGFLKCEGDVLVFKGADIFSEASPSFDLRGISVVIMEQPGPDYETAHNRLKEAILDMARRHRPWAALLKMMHGQSHAFGGHHPVDVGWKCWEHVGIEVKEFKADRTERSFFDIPNVSGKLMEGDEVLCGGMFGWYKACIRHTPFLHAESEHYIFPIEWGERRKCWVARSQINKACLNRINPERVAGSFKVEGADFKKEDVGKPFFKRDGPPGSFKVGEITDSVRIELEGPDPNNRSDDQGE